MNNSYPCVLKKQIFITQMIVIQTNTTYWTTNNQTQTPKKRMNMTIMLISNIMKDRKISSSETEF